MPSKPLRKSPHLSWRLDDIFSLELLECLTKHDRHHWHRNLYWTSDLDGSSSANPQKSLLLELGLTFTEISVVPRRNPHLKCTVINSNHFQYFHFFDFIFFLNIILKIDQGNDSADDPRSDLGSRSPLHSSSRYPHCIHGA